MYQIKLYTKAKVYKKTINLNLVKNRISFTKQINGWLWQLTLVLDLWLSNTDFIQWDLIEVYNFESGSNLIYAWYIDQINKSVTNFEETQIIAYWLASLLKRIVYNVTWNYTATINKDPYTAVGDIVTYFNTKYNYLTLSWSLTWATTSYVLNYTDSYKAIDDLNNLSSNYYWYLENYTLNFKPKPTTAIHTFTLQKDLVELNIDEDTTELTNTLILTYKTWTKTYTDATSISTYGIREKYISNTQIWDVTSADIFWAKYIADNKNPKQKMTLVVNNVADINNINPWDTCKIRNINKSWFDNLLISKINYNQYEITIDLEAYDNFIQLIK
jgi:hypothetical protein